MLVNFLLLLLLPFCSNGADCGHFFEYPIDTCFSDGIKIQCEGSSAGAQEIKITVEQYENEKCLGTSQVYEPKDEGTDELIDFSAFCTLAEGACSCSNEQCEVFEWEYEQKCVYANNGGSSESSGDRSVIINQCVPYFSSVLSDMFDSVLYVLWQCNDEFDGEPDNERDLPVIAKLYSDAKCSQYLMGEDSLEMESGDTDDTDSCDSMTGNSVSQCQFQTGSTGDISVCSHFNHYAIGVCGTDYHIEDSYNSFYYESSEIICSINDGTYTQNYYDSRDCSGDIVNSADVTDACITDGCNCHDSDADGEGDSLLCDIAKKGYEYTCDDDASFQEDYVGFYILENCVDKIKYECQTSSSGEVYINQREYTDDQCLTPEYSECNYNFETTCDYNNVNSTGNSTAGCGYVTYSNEFRVLDFCYTDSYTDYDGITSGNSEIFHCSDGLFSVNKYYDGSDCSGSPSYSHSVSCTEGVDCVCGVGSLCNVAERIESYSCDDLSADSHIDYYLIDTCGIDPQDSSLSVKYSCSDSEGIEKVIYSESDATCENIKSECLGWNEQNSGDFEERTFQCLEAPVGDMSNCGYYDDYPMDTCVHGQSSFDYSYSYYRYCTMNGETATYHYDAYDTYDCSGDVSYSGTDECSDDHHCHCVSDSQCATYRYETVDSCYGDQYFYTEVMGICEPESCSGDDDCSKKDMCSNDDSYDTTYYSDTQCRVEQVDECTYKVTYDDASEETCEDEWDLPPDTGARASVVSAIFFVCTILVF